MKKHKLFFYFSLITRRDFMRISLWITWIIFSVILFSCSKDDDDTVVNPVNNTEVFTVVEHSEFTIEDVMNQILMTTDDPDEFDYHDLYYSVVQETGNILPYLIAHEVVTYKSTDNKGNPIELTGLFIYPYRLIGSRINTPLISVNHGTELLKKYAPSKWKSNYNPLDWGNFAEVIIADIMASWYGWAIVMPDYQGMGGDVGENHPYCVREKLATATADMVQVGINTIKDNNHKWVKWDGNVFTYGYSEGGFVTMAATRELEKRGVTMKGAVCMDGPYDLTGAMMNVMLSDNPFPVPYFLPMLFVGYNTIYPADFIYDSMLKAPYNTNIPKYTTGFYSTDVVNSIMPSSHILKEVFTPRFMAALQDTGSTPHKILWQNNTYPDWQPKTTMLLWHCKNDDCVPFGNFETAKAAFSVAGATNITYVEWPPVTDWAGTVHVSVAPRAFYEGASWIHQQLQ